MMLRGIALKSFSGIVAVALASCVYTLGQSRSAPADPGVRGGPAGAGTPLKGLTADETAFFQDGQARFAEVEVVTKGSNNGLGPRFNSNIKGDAMFWRRVGLAVVLCFLVCFVVGCAAGHNDLNRELEISDRPVLALACRF